MTAIDPQARSILEERARLLARPLAESAAPAAATELLVFGRSGTTYAVDANCVAQVVPLAEPTPLVSVPPAVVGVMNHRGRIVAVVDIAALVPNAAAEGEDNSFAVVLRAGDAWFALLADSVSGIARVEDGDVRPTAALGDGSDTWMRGLTADLTVILDVEALSRDPRVEVDDEIE